MKKHRRKVGQANSSNITRCNTDLPKGAHGQACQKPWPICLRRFMGKGHQTSRAQISKSGTCWFASGLWHFKHVAFFNANLFRPWLSPRWYENYNSICFLGLLLRCAWLCSRVQRFATPMDCRTLRPPPGSSVHGILQAWILLVMPFSRGSSQPRDQTQVSCIAGRFFISWGK